MKLSSSDPVSDTNGLLIFQINTLYSDQNMSNMSENYNTNYVVYFMIYLRRYVINRRVILHIKWETSDLSESCGNSSGWNPKWDITMLLRLIQSLCCFVLQESPPDLDCLISHVLFDHFQKWTCSVCVISLQICSHFTTLWPLWHLQRSNI